MKQLRIAVTLFLFLTLLTGIIYPLFITLIGQIVFPWQANGSLIQQENKNVGSLLIGQSFTDAKYFWGRPSATTPFPYNASNSSGSNFSPSNKIFLATIQQRFVSLKNSDPAKQRMIPVDLLMASGSGLDPEISPAAAFYQIPRIAKDRKIPEFKIRQLVNSSIKHRFLGFWGEPRVNVLLLNIALNNLQ